MNCTLRHVLVEDPTARTRRGTAITVTYRTG